MEPTDDTLDSTDDAHVGMPRRGYVLVPRRVHELADELPLLDARERDVLQAVMAGQSNRQIARTLGVSEATVKRTVASIVARLGAARRENLTAVALELGFRPAPVSGGMPASGDSWPAGRRPALNEDIPCPR